MLSFPGDKERAQDFFLLNSRCGNNSLQTISYLLTPLAFKLVNFSSPDFEAHVRNILFFSFNPIAKFETVLFLTWNDFFVCLFFVLTGADSLYRSSFSLSDEKLNSPTASTPSLPSPSVTPCKGKLKSSVFLLNSQLYRLLPLGKDTHLCMNSQFCFHSKIRITDKHTTSARIIAAYGQHSVMRHPCFFTGYSVAFGFELPSYRKFFG